MFVLQIVNEMETEKEPFLRTLCRNIANTMYRPDPDNFLVQRRAEDLCLDPSDLNVANFGSRVYRSLHRKVCDVTDQVFIYIKYYNHRGSVILFITT